LIYQQIPPITLSALCCIAYFGKFRMFVVCSVTKLACGNEIRNKFPGMRSDPDFGNDGAGARGRVDFVALLKSHLSGQVPSLFKELS
jgi:hypothetical protein